MWLQFLSSRVSRTQISTFLASGAEILVPPWLVGQPGSQYGDSNSWGVSMIDLEFLGNQDKTKDSGRHKIPAGTTNGFGRLPSLPSH